MHHPVCAFINLVLFSQNCSVLLFQVQAVNGQAFTLLMNVFYLKIHIFVLWLFEDERKYTNNVLI